VNKRLWVNIGLLGLIITLCLIILNNEEEIKKELPRLSTINQNDINQIKVLRKNLDDFTFTKEGDIWHLDSPRQFRANNARINAMLRMLKVESHSQLKPAEVKLETIGLSGPIVILKLNDHEFKFGITDAIDQRRYVLFEGRVHLVNDFLYHQLMTNIAFFADQKLLPEATEINSIKYPDNKIELINDNWQMQTLVDISPDKLERISYNWENASALTVSIYEAPETESFISISTSRGDTFSFVIVSTKPHLILGRKDLDIQYNMASNEITNLLLIENAEINEKSESLDFELR
jgi:hypothetical protein